MFDRREFFDGPRIVINHQTNPPLQSTTFRHVCLAEALAVVGGDLDVLSEMAEMARPALAIHFEQLTHAVREQDLPQVEQLAHKLKGTLSIVGAGCCEELACDLEDAAAKGNAETLPLLLAEFSHHIEDLKPELDQLVSSLADNG